MLWAMLCDAHFVVWSLFCDDPGLWDAGKPERDRSEKRGTATQTMDLRLDSNLTQTALHLTMIYQSFRNGVKRPITHVDLHYRPGLFYISALTRNQESPAICGLQHEVRLGKLESPVSDC